MNVWEFSGEERRSPVLLQVNGQKFRAHERGGGGGRGGKGWARRLGRGAETK